MVRSAVLVSIAFLAPGVLGLRVDDGEELDTLDDVESREVAEGEQHAESEGEGFPCRKYEICKCESAGYESATTCKSDTCTYTPWAPGYCCASGKGWCFSPDCPKIKSWKSCMWANFNDKKKAFDGPGQDHYVDLPEAPRASGVPLAVLSDVDDTMKCSGGGVAGADKQCLGTKPHKMYPGGTDFALALARGANNSMQPMKVIPLSARPNELKWILRMKEGSMEAKAYRAAGERAGVQTFGLDTQLAKYGSFFDFADQLWNMKLTRFSRMGHRKFANWKKIMPHIGGPTAFIGDNGQGDAVAAQMMLKESPMYTDAGGAMHVSFIHDVLLKCRSEECRASWAKVGIHMFEHYPHAAGIALRLGWISRESCSQVCAAAPTLECTCVAGSDNATSTAE